MSLDHSYNFNEGTGLSAGDSTGSKALTFLSTSKVGWTASGKNAGGLIGTSTDSNPNGGGDFAGATATGMLGSAATEFAISWDMYWPATASDNAQTFLSIMDASGNRVLTVGSGGSSGWVRSLLYSTSGTVVIGDCGSTTGNNNGTWHRHGIIVTATQIINVIDGVASETVSRTAGSLDLSGGFSVLGIASSAYQHAGTNVTVDNLRVYSHAPTVSALDADMGPVGVLGPPAATATGMAYPPVFSDGTGNVAGLVSTATGLAAPPTITGDSAVDGPGAVAVGTGLALPPSVSSGSPDASAYAVVAIGYRTILAPQVVGGTGTPGQFDTTPSLEDLIQEVLLHLHGFSTKGDQVTSLSDDVTATARTFTVDDADTVSRGILEIGDELVRVQSVDRSSGVVTVLPKGRGWRGTLASKHEAGDTITMAPLAPRQVVAYAINDTIASLYPDLFGVDSVEFPFDNPVAVSWQLPAEAEMILSVRYRDILGNWQKVRTWELENVMSPRDFESGKGVRIYGVPLGQTVQVVYGKVPTILPTVVDKFSTTGLLPGWRDIIVLGAQARIIPSLDTARLSLRTVSADQLDQPIQLGSAVQLAKDMRGRFQQRVAQERAALLNRYPAPVHFTR